MKVELYLLRHADAGDPDAWEGPDDERPLSDKGIRQSKRLGAFLVMQGHRPAVILSSPKKRAAQTAEIVADLLNLEVALEDALAEDVGLAAVSTLIDAHGADKPMLVGHDPDFSALVAVLCGSARVPMKKCALARIDGDHPLQPGAGTLRWLVPPDMLKSG